MRRILGASIISCMDGTLGVETAGQLLRQFERDIPVLFLGSAFVVIGVLASAASLLRRKFDSALLWFGLFALLYGLRECWLESRFVGLTLPAVLLQPGLVKAVDYLVPLPALFYFRNARYLSRLGERLVYPLAALTVCIVTATLILGPQPFLRALNYMLVYGFLLLLAASCLRKPDAASGMDARDFRIVRLALLLFVLLAVWNNIPGVHLPQYVEALGFFLFLCSLGYVTMRRNLERDSELLAVQKELAYAEQIQRSILPPPFPEFPNFRVAARYAPMRSVAGDFYDFPLADREEVGLLIADVSGHGVAAALIASMVKLAAASQRDHIADPAAFLTGMNGVLCGNTQSQFVTAAYVHLSATLGEMRYAAAAHPPLLLLREGEVAEILENGLMLGAFATAEYAMTVQTLQPGDRLLLYTDGIMEAANARHEEFGRERLGALLRETQQLPHEEAADLILSTVQRWSASQEDDLTLLVCDYQHSPRRRAMQER